jgi:nucleotide-binding universal stress UspA family protein
MAPQTVLCALADDDRHAEVAATGRALQAEGGYRPLFAHVVAPSTGAAVPAGFMERSARPSEAVVVRGDPAAELVRLAREHDAAFIVVGTRGRGLLSGIMLGRVCSALVRGAGRPVLITRPAVKPLHGGPIVCGVDVDRPGDRAAAARAAELARRTGRRLVLVDLVDGAALDRFAARRRADVLVVGARDGGVVRTLPAGGVRQDAIRRGHTPLLVVPPADLPVSVEPAPSGPMARRLVDGPGRAHLLSARACGLADDVRGDGCRDGQQHGDEHHPGQDRAVALKPCGDQEEDDPQERGLSGRVQLGVDVGQADHAVDADRHDDESHDDERVGEHA